MMEHKKNTLKTEHQCTFVCNINFTNHYPFLGIFTALGPIFQHTKKNQGFTIMSGKM